MILKWLASSVIALVVGSSVWLGSLVDQKASQPSAYRLALLSTAQAQHIKVAHAPAMTASAAQRPVSGKAIRLETQ
ncbi:hypothetical protein WG899_04650 [Paucibacter sp. AS339]|uniref:hypothetical protein n=1 Tax=Paucibacter hankyongi TaxID=3133434 RepID=UPI0030ABF6F4